MGPQLHTGGGSGMRTPRWQSQRPPLRTGLLNCTTTGQLYVSGNSDAHPEVLEYLRTEVDLPPPTTEAEKRQKQQSTLSTLMMCCGNSCTSMMTANTARSQPSPGGRTLSPPTSRATIVLLRLRRPLATGLQIIGRSAWEMGCFFPWCRHSG